MYGFQTLNMWRCGKCGAVNVGERKYDRIAKCRLLEIMANALYVKTSSLIPLLKSWMLIYCLSIVFIEGKRGTHNSGL